MWGSVSCGPFQAPDRATGCPLTSFISGSCFLPSQSGQADRKSSGRWSTVKPARNSLHGGDSSARGAAHAALGLKRMQSIEARQHAPGS